MKRQIIKQLKLVFFYSLISFTHNLSSAPGELSNLPLFLGAQVPPNILFTVDDSGSMDWEVLKSNGALSTTAYNIFPNSGNIDRTPTPTDTAEMLESCAGYNVMYYDPTKTYTPWIGVDVNGDPYVDQSITAARWNPYDPSWGSVNLTVDDCCAGVPGYIPWDDTDGDNQFDSGECGDDPLLYTVDYSRFVSVVSMSAAEQTNFANWYSYYRKREYIVKRSLSEIITDSIARVGLATLHNHNSVGTQIEDVNNISAEDAASKAAAETNKNALLENLFRIDSSSGTPLRLTLQEVGEYFDAGDPGPDLFGFSPSPTTPILSEAEGGACQQNFSVLLSDGFWNGGNPSIAVFGNADGDDSSEFDGGSYADNVTSIVTLADIAMHYYEKDLSPLENNVPTITGVDENDAQHMVSYTVAFGVNGSLTDNPPNTEDPFAWPTPSSGSLTTIDDLRHAAWNGRGEFLSASNPQELIDSLNDAIQGIQDRTGSATSISFNTTNISADTLLYQAVFDSSFWHGSLQAYEFDSEGVGGLVWDSGEIMDGRDFTIRQIITYNGSEGIPFVFPSNYKDLPASGKLSELQVKDLLVNAPNSFSTTDSVEISQNQSYGEDIVDYLRGDNSKIISRSFRDRDGHKLGDIVHSSPQYVGVPQAIYPNDIEGIGDSTQFYSEFIKKHTGPGGRSPVVYVGANDGMLHAFDANVGGAGGQEIFAYMPGLLFSDSSSLGLHKLAEMDYGHLPYVDGTPTVQDVYVNKPTETKDWRTFLVGGLRAGGKGIYVLDITDPTILDDAEANADKIVVKEFTHAQLGYTFSRPQIARLNDGRWAAIFGNGYNNDPDGDGTAKLFILYLDFHSDPDPDDPSTREYLILETLTGSIASEDCLDSSSDCNGLSSPVLLDLNGDAILDRVYAGDLHGNLWAFDLSDSDSNKWGVAYGSDSPKPAPTATPEPLFIACSDTPCTTSNRQPITVTPAVIGHPLRRDASTDPNLLVYFGTGQYLTNNDIFTTDKQSFYGVWDAGADYTKLDKDDLQEQEATTSGVRRDLSTNVFNYTATGSVGDKLGWYINLPVPGERSVVSPIVAGDFVFFATTIPDDTQCSAGGRGFLMVANKITGGQPDFAALDLNNDGIFDDDEKVGGYELTGGVPGGTIIIDDIIMVPDSSGFAEGDRGIGVKTRQDVQSRRASWSIVK